MATNINLLKRFSDMIIEECKTIVEAHNEWLFQAGEDEGFGGQHTAICTSVIGRINNM
jgi:hypothetical protein